MKVLVLHYGTNISDSFNFEKRRWFFDQTRLSCYVAAGFWFEVSTTSGLHSEPNNYMTLVTVNVNAKTETN